MGVALFDAIAALPGIFAESELISDGGIEIRYKAESPHAAEFMDLVTELSGDAAPFVSWVDVGWSGEDVNLAVEKIMAEMKAKGLTFSGGSFEPEHREFLAMSPNSTEVTLSNQRIGTMDVRVCVVLGVSIPE